MLSPKRVKFRRPQKGKNRGMANSGNYVCYGTYGLKAVEPGWLSSRQIEAGRVSISKRVRKVGRLWIRIFPHKSITKKPAETRMGNGKGAPEYWVSIIKPGRIIYEIDGLSEEEAKETFRACAHKLPMKTKLVSRREL